MKGFMIYGAGKAELRGDILMPVLGPNETLIKVKYAGICGSDIHPWRTGIKFQNNDVPYVLGHEFIGTVIESNNDGNVLFKNGDLVTGSPIYWCGICPACQQGRHSICHNMKVMAVVEGGNGTYAEYVKLPSKNLIPFKPGIDKIIAAVTEPLAVGLYDVRMSGLRAGQVALISGGGTIGAMIGICARRAGARVLYSEINENRIAFLRKLGFEAINPRGGNALESIKMWNDQKLFDVVFEVTGAQESYDLCLDACVQGGTFMVIGVVTTPRSLFMRRVLAAQIRVQGANCYEDCDFAEAVKIVNSGSMDKELRSFVTDIFPIDQAFEAYMRAMDPIGNQVKVLIDCDPESELTP
jgi:threonine dehydrogenase-like Zn-dependent dehydrogenase